MTHLTLTYTDAAETKPDCTTVRPQKWLQYTRDNTQGTINKKQGTTRDNKGQKQGTINKGQ